MHDNVDTTGTGKSVAYPATIQAAVKQLLETLPLRDKVQIANLGQEELIDLVPVLGTWIRHNFGLLSGNDSLKRECIQYHSKSFIHIDDDEAAMIIIYELWKQVKDTHRLRVVG